MSIPAGNRADPLGPNVVIECPAGYNGVRLLVEGQELRELVDLKFHAPCDGVAQVEAVANVTTGFRLEANARVVVQAIVLPGYQLVEARDPVTGCSIYRCEPERPQDVTSHDR